MKALPSGDSDSDKDLSKEKKIPNAIKEKTRQTGLLRIDGREEIAAGATIEAIAGNSSSGPSSRKNARV